MKKFLLSIAVAAGFAASSFAASPAQFPGGPEACKKYISSNLKYPERARENGIEGVVGLIFTVNTDGSIGNIRIKRMVDPDLESESIRLVKQMPAWTPASNDAGTPVESSAEVNVEFTLN